MKKSGTLLILTPALIALSSCGGGDSNSSLGKESDSLEESASLSNLDPGDAKSHFDAQKEAREKTTKADSIRIYTPHANATLGINENGYLKSSFGFGIEASIEEEGKEPSEYTGSISATVSQMPLDLRARGLQSEDKKDVVLSFANYIGDVDANVGGDLAGYPFSKLTLPTEIHIEDGISYFDLSSLSKLLFLATGERLPSSGKFSLDLSEEFDLFSTKLDDFLSFDFQEGEGYDEIKDKLGFNEIDFDQLFDQDANFDYDLYEAIGPSFYDFGVNSITFKITSEDDLLQFGLHLYDSRPEEEKAKISREEFESELRETLDSMEFDHFISSVSYASNGLAYQSCSFKIASFDSEKIKEKEAKETSEGSIYPTGEWSFSWGLAYEYDHVEPDVLTAKEKEKYTHYSSEELSDAMKEIFQEASSSGEER